MKFYAHSTSRQDRSDWQPLSDHLATTGELAETAAAAFGCGPLAKAAGLLHDLGKYTERFQRRLEGGERVDHSTHGGDLHILDNPFHGRANRGSTKGVFAR